MAGVPAAVDPGARCAGGAEERAAGIARQVFTWLGSYAVAKGIVTDTQLALWVGSIVTIGLSLWGIASPAQADRDKPKTARIFSAARHSLAALGGAVVGMGWLPSGLVEAIVAGLTQFGAVFWAVKEKPAPRALPVNPPRDYSVGAP